MANPLASLQPELWTASSNDALQIYVTENGAATSFKPNFTYPIFGDSETVFGYKDLVIFLCFDHCTFLPFLNVKYLEKLDDEDIVDPKSKLMEFLPDSTVFKDEGLWLEKTEEESQKFKIPGELVEGLEFTKEGEDYAVYKINLQSLEGEELHKRLQILVLLFIEAGSYIDSKDKLWDVHVLYKVTDRDTPSVAGFVTAYNYWKYPGCAKFDKGEEEVRMKISQFIILPNYQGLGLGGSLYNILYNHWRKEDRVVEIVIEDPNEQFDDLRDRCDLQTVHRELPGSLKISDITPEWYNKTRAQFKFEKRQFSRLLEMLLLHDGSNGKKNIRLFVKKRLYEKNKETLESLDQPTRLDKLQTAFESLEQDYRRILKPVKFKRSGDSVELSNKKQK